MPDGYYQDPDGVWRLHVTVTKYVASSPDEAGIAGISDFSGGATVEILPGFGGTVSCGGQGCYGIVGATEGFSSKVNIDLLGSKSLYHAKTAGYKGGLGIGANGTIGLPIPAAVDTLFGTTIFQAVHGLKGPIGLDITAFVTFSDGSLQGTLDVDLVPAVGQSGVVGVGYEGRHE